MGTNVINLTGLVSLQIIIRSLYILSKQVYKEMSYLNIFIYDYYFDDLVSD